MNFNDDILIKEGIEKNKLKVMVCFSFFYVLLSILHNSFEYPDTQYYKYMMCSPQENNYFFDSLYNYTINFFSGLWGSELCDFNIERNPSFSSFGGFQIFNTLPSAGLHFSYVFIRLVNLFVFLFVIFLSPVNFSIFLPFIFYSSFLTTDIYVQVLGILFFRWPIAISIISVAIIVFGLSSETVIIIFLPTLLGAYIVRYLQSYIGWNKTVASLILLTLIFIYVGNSLLGGLALNETSQLAMAIGHNQFGSNPFLALGSSLFGTYGYMSFINFPFAMFAFLIVLFFVFNNQNYFQSITNSSLFQLFISSFFITIVVSSIFPWVSQIRFYPLLFGSFYLIFTQIVACKIKVDSLTFIYLSNFFGLLFVLLTWWG